MTSLQILIKEKESFIQESVEVPRYFYWHELFLCPVCYEVWAEVIPEDSEEKWVKLVSCESCNTEKGTFTAGSILNDHFCNMHLNSVLLKSLSSQLLYREAKLSLKSFEAESCQTQSQSNPPSYLSYQESMCFLKVPLVPEKPTLSQP